MTGNGATSSLPCVPGKVPFTIRFADLRHRPLPTVVVEFTTDALASRLRASWMERVGNEGGQGFGKVFAVLARLRFRPNQEKVRSTTQRRCRTTKPLLSSRLTICITRKNRIFPMTLAIAGRSKRQTDRSLVRR
jgi:hypothetical protein